MQETLSWILEALGAIVVMVIGFEGNLGTVLGCIFTPAYITIG